MSKTITQALKLILAVFSIYLCYYQFTMNNSTVGIYWIVVAAYWISNFISGLPNKK